jgi:formylglycine-generating enzyme required for sulfatase activity/endonuclease YncB( thermonuclease family)
MNVGWLANALVTVVRYTLLVLAFLVLLLLVLHGLGLFGIAVAVVGAALLFFSPGFRTWLLSRRGYARRLSHLPGLHSESPVRLSTAWLAYILPVSLVSWFLIGATFDTDTILLTLLLAVAGIILLYGWFIHGWRLPNGGGEETVASPKFSTTAGIDFLKQNKVAAAALVLGLMSPFICYPSAVLIFPDLVTPSATPTGSQAPSRTTHTLTLTPTVMAQRADTPLAPTNTTAPRKAPSPSRTPRQTETAMLFPTSTSPVADVTPEAGAVRRRATDSMTVVYIAAGEFIMGTSDAQVEVLLTECWYCDREVLSDEQPQHTVFVDAFWIDRTEVTNAQFRLCVEEGACKEPEFWGDIRLDGSALPVVGVAWEDATAYCRWAGGRLPTEAEWEKAARGTDGRVYPWGNDFDGIRANFCDRSCEFWDEDHDLDVNDGSPKTAPVGSYPAGASALGVLDMAGNVWEWSADWYGKGYYRQSPAENPQGPESGEYRAARSGSWETDIVLLRTSIHEGLKPDARLDDVGFRCVLDDGSQVLEAPGISGRAEARVVDVVDGDTIKVEIDGETYTLRYIGIDTPETVQPGKPVEWMGLEATAANLALVGGKAVYLEKDVSETDRLGRLLRYVYLADGTLVNAELVRLGYAVSSSYPPDVKHQDVLRQMEQEARAAGQGLWGPTPAPEASATPNVAPTAPPATAAPTATTAAVATPAPTGPRPAQIVIVAVDKRAEVVDIQNVGGSAQDLTGWVLVSEKGDQRCSLGGQIQAGATLRIWALAADAGQGGYNCGFGTTVWNNDEPDPAVLYDAQGNEVARY